MLQDNDLLHFANGQYSYYNTAEESSKLERNVTTLDFELGQIDMGKIYVYPSTHTIGGHKHFMHKEICEQPDTVVNTMRGRLNFEKNAVKLGGIEAFLQDIRNSRRLIFIACGTSYHSAIAVHSL